MNSIMREDWEEIIYENAVYKISTSKQKLKQKQYLKSGTIPIVDQGQDLIGGYTNDENRIIECDLPVLVFGDHTKITKLIDFKFTPGADGTKILEPSKFVLPEYLSIFTKVLTLKIKDNGYARHYQHIEKEFLPLAPLPVQRSIISKTEELFSDLDNGIANFKKAQEQLKIYRQAVLKKAFEGGFSITNEESITNDELGITNEENQSNHTNQKNQSSDNLPKGWKWVKISDVCDMKAGYFIKADEINSEFEDGLFPCYGGNGLRGYVKSTTHEGLFPIVGRQGALCGNVHLVNGKFHATEHAVVVSAKKDIDIKCLYYKLIEMKTNQYATGTAQPGLSVNKILPIEIIYPSSLQEQNQIVQEIESRLSVTDNLEFVIRNSIEKAEALRQSILKKAFEGKLLSKAEIELCKQAADYEPASELLKKIQAEKLAKELEKKKPTVKKKTKK